MFKNYIELAKPRITLMVALTALLGYWLANGAMGLPLVWTLLGVVFASSCAGCFNQLLEIEQDSKMRRTCGRPLPQGRISPKQALFVGLFFALSGLSILAFGINGLSALLTALTLATYIFAYTLLKRRTPLCTWLGAISGATPPMIGWVAARGALEAPAWILFFIQFLWQIPHFLALFWMYREDYKAAGFKVMPVMDPTGGTTAFGIALHCFALLLASLLPFFAGLANFTYALGVLLMGSCFLVLGFRASWTLANQDMRHLFLASLAYLPLLFGMLVVNRSLSLASRFSIGYQLPTPNSPSYGQVPDFELTDQYGRRVSRSELRGPWVASFIFSRCSNQCPMLTANIRVLKEQLPSDMRLVSFSVDPTDTPAILERYSKMHRANWLFLTGTKNEVRKLSIEGFRLPVAESANPREPILHSKSLVLVDSDGKIRGYFDGMDGASLTSLIREARLITETSNDGL